MNNLYAEFTEKILNLPLWVKEITYFLLKQNLKTTLPCSNIEVNEEDLYQYLCPEITYAGKKECERLKIEEPDSNMYQFLNCLMNNLSIVEITLNNAWTLEETSQIYFNCIESQFVARPENPIINAKAAYLAGRIRIGEYLKRVGLIDVDQLENAMRIQKESELANQKKGFASILVDLDLVTRDDTDAILLIKQESKRRFLLDFSTTSADTHIESIRAENDARKIERLTYENNLLKAKLREVLNLNN